VKRLNRLILLCLVAGCLANLNPLLKFLQFVMSVLVFGNFVADNGAHLSSEACDKIAGVLGIDTSLALTTSVMAWYLLLPAIYMLSKVLVPADDQVPEKFQDLEDVNEPTTDDKFASRELELVKSLSDDVSRFEYKDRIISLEHSKFLTEKEFEHIVDLFNEVDLDGSGYINQEETQELLFKFGLDNTSKKAAEVFAVLDQDGSGEIDFDEFCEFIVLLKNHDDRFVGFADVLDSITNATVHVTQT
jgi:EF-hand domain pair